MRVPAASGQAASRDRDLRIQELRVPGGSLVARFAPGAGMVGYSLCADGVELLGILGAMDAYLDRGSVFGIPLLHPWANRLGGWSYAVAGRTVRLDRGSPLLHGDAHCLPIHGAVAAGSDWQVTGTGADEHAAWLEVELDWAAHADLLEIFPFAHRVSMAISLRRDVLRIESTVHATGETPVPVSFGFHPYLAPPGAPRERWHVELPALTHLPLDRLALPTGAREPRPAERFTLGRRTYDDLFAVDGGTARFAVSDGVRRIVVELEAGYPYAQVYAPPDHPVICFEPMTAPVDALRSHDGLVCVDPGGSTTAAFALRVEPEA
jgi:galactose mutarotase-like enzyme